MKNNIGECKKQKKNIQKGLISELNVIGPYMSNIL